ncbi:MAG: class I SAM-dependent methyltransferase [Desulfobacterales bacterium]|nr:class I SAM-dependent methyltransferase [Pseudomonadota bacterium]MCG2773785.1 class I SAM-dependent methyltransferase [Desulfobacterales bacterium]
MTTVTNTAGPLAPPLSLEAYAHCFLTFRKHSTEWLAMLRWSQERLLPRLPVKSPFAVLSVGAGNGDFDRRFAPLLHSRLKNMEYVMVEPNAALCRRLRECLAGHAGEGVRFEVDPLTFEDFAIRRIFDLVHFTHCLYYIPDRQAAIDHALKAIGPKGLVLIFHQTPWGIDQVQQRFLKRVKGSDQEMFTSREIQAILERGGIPYHLEEVESHINVSECFRPGSAEGEALLSFFLESDVRHLDPALKQEVLAYLHNLTYSREDRRLLHHPVAIFSLPPHKDRE